MRFWIHSMSVMGLLMVGMVLSHTSNARPDNALKNYLQRNEAVYSWTVKDKNTIQNVDVYDLLLTSQTWQNIVWKHQLRVYVPQQPQAVKTALLFITGGSNKNSEPNWSPWEGKIDILGRIAVVSHCPVAVLKQVPNQPLFGEKVEDDLISHTFLQYFETEDETWPLLFPMVKSAVQAMTAIQEFCVKETSLDIESFVVSGGSKRGWTTWLTGASDRRVIGIAPMVIDTLNMAVQMDYQLECWGKYSDQIADYTQKGIQPKMKTPIGKKLLRMVDPYSYRKKVTVPKLIFIGTNDEYWPVDAIKFYFDDLVGEKYIHYVPNAGHDLGGGEQAARSLGAFFALCATHKKHPKLKDSAKVKNGKAVITVKTDATAKHALLWSAQSPDRDFRNDEWSSKPVQHHQGTSFSAEVPLPEQGFRSAYVEIHYPSLLGDTYSKCSRMYVLTPDGIVK